jgi:hypothetical protein
MGEGSSIHLARCKDGHLTSAGTGKEGDIWTEEYGGFPDAKFIGSTAAINF